MADIAPSTPEAKEVAEALAAIDKFADLLISTVCDGRPFDAYRAEVAHRVEVARVADWHVRASAALIAGTGLPPIPAEAAAYVGLLLQVEIENTDGIIEILTRQQARIRKVRQWLLAAPTTVADGCQRHSLAVRA